MKYNSSPLDLFLLSLSFAFAWPVIAPKEPCKWCRPLLLSPVFPFAFLERVVLCQIPGHLICSINHGYEFLLQSVVDASAQRLVNLAQQWEKHRAPLIDQYRELKQLNANRMVSTYSFASWYFEGI